ncbi:FG-GAP repeat domain-containing protein [Robertmurraya siralis]|uniref:FG-GAP repeat domain-containing protein n=1 Tax=Robertmurraya siralis TaxID=77777 RepID=UPI000BA55739|nr:VCBS repeat-containing protein [Robertmurraya siralis]PAE19861.1 hypothetical protein CHH80_14080 [Bacillus sp. 7504-2]
MKGKLKIFILIAVFIILSACDIIDMPSLLVKGPSDLIESPPSGDRQKTALREKVQQLLPVNVEFVTAKHGLTKESIIVEDTNGDGELEAVVLYRENREDRNVQLLFLHEKDGEWEQLTKLETDYYLLDYFMLSDLDEDGVLEVVIGLYFSDFETEKQLLIYEWNNGNFQQVLERPYDVLDVADYNRDGREELLVIHGKKREFYNAELFQYENKELQLLDIVSLDPYAFHENVESGKLSDGHQALFIDSAIGAHSMTTEMVVFGDEGLIKLEEDMIKAKPLYSRDMNNDGVLEVGSMYIPQGWEETAFADIPFIEYYSTYSIAGDSHKVMERYTDRERRFYIEIPPVWFEKVTLNKLDNGVQLVDIASRNVLFEVRWQEKDKLAPASATILEETKDMVFYTEMEEMKGFPFAQFHLLQDEF